MTKRLSITKTEIIKALQEETRLESGNFIVEPNVAGERCSVCAVGSILRRKLIGLDFAQIRSFCNHTVTSPLYSELEERVSRLAKIKIMKKKRQWLSLLSSEFEYLYNDPPYIEIKKVVTKLVAFVQRHFPERFYVSEYDMK